MARKLRLDTRGERVFLGFNAAFLALLGIATVLPFIHIIAVSFATPDEAITSRFLLIPTTFTLDNYEHVLNNPQILRSLYMSLLITAGGTATALVFTAVTAYPLSIRDLKGRKAMVFFILLTMLFRAGIVPNYLLIRSIGLLDTLLAVILPAALVPFYVIIAINFFKSVPDELRQSARIDGANEFRVLRSIIIPLSKPILATLTLFFAVNYWNEFLRPLLYLSDPKNWPIQVMLRQIVILAQALIMELDFDPGEVPPPQKTINMTVIVVATFPILVVYPFLQKHFAKGIMLGSVKG